MPVGLKFTRGFMILAGSAIVLWMLSWLKPVLMPMALAILLAFSLSPAVTLLQRLRLPRALAVAAVVMAAFSLITSVGWGGSRGRCPVSSIRFLSMKRISPSRSVP